MTLKKDKTIIFLLKSLFTGERCMSREKKLKVFLDDSIKIIKCERLADKSRESI